ncbi:MAG: hypothetical protein ACW98Y_17030 [Candidatus Thorarchaeota archaeon]|jgi:hypothetical protein
MAKIDLVRRPTLISPRHLLRYVFFTEMQVEQAAKILNEIVASNGVVPDSEWERFVLSSRGLYVKVIRKLRDVGLVEKRMGDYRLARDFSSALGKIGKYWEDIVEEFSEGDKSIAF